MGLLDLRYLKYLSPVAPLGIRVDFLKAVPPVLISDELSFRGRSSGDFVQLCILKALFRAVGGWTRLRPTSKLPGSPSLLKDYKYSYVHNCKKPFSAIIQRLKNQKNLDQRFFHLHE